MKKLKKNIIPKTEKQIALEYITSILSKVNKPVLLNPKQAIDRDIFMKLIKHHKLSSIVYKTVSEQKINISDELLQHLELVNKRNKMQMLKLSSELIILHQLLTKYNIDYIVLKGPALSQQLYGDYTIRNSKDLDILIPDKSLNTVYEILIKHGYTPKHKNSFLKRLSDKDQTFLSPNNITIEIHYRLFNNKYFLPLPENIFNKPNYTNINNFAIPVLPKHLNYLYQICHAAAHNWSRMVWSIDIIKYKSILTEQEIKDSYTYASLTGTSKIFNQALNMSLNNFDEISNEKHYSLLKKFVFLLSLNSRLKYKRHEVLQRLLIPYRILNL